MYRTFSKPDGVTWTGYWGRSSSISGSRSIHTACLSAGFWNIIAVWISSNIFTKVFSQMIFKECCSSLVVLKLFLDEVDASPLYSAILISIYLISLAVFTLEMFLNLCLFIYNHAFHFLKIINPF